MLLEIHAQALREIHAHAERVYPEEGVGLLLGKNDGERRHVVSILPLSNVREQASRRNRYLLTPQDYLRAEQEAERRNLEVLGVFHSHPDHPNQPSSYDLEWALPGFSYLITSVWSARAMESRSWRLKGDRSGFIEETLLIIE